VELSLKQIVTVAFLQIRLKLAQQGEMIVLGYLAGDNLFGIGEIRTTQHRGSQRIWFTWNNKRIWAEKMNYNEQHYKTWISTL